MYTTKATKRTGFVIAIIITFFFVALSVNFAGFSVKAEEFEEAEMTLLQTDEDFTTTVDWYYYYDMNDDGIIDIPDLVMISKAMDEEDTLFTISDYNLVRSLITTGTTESKMHCTSISLNESTFDLDKRLRMSAYTSGKLVDIQIDGDFLRVRFFNGDCRITEIKTSQHESCDDMPIVYAFNYKDKHVGMAVNDEGLLVWDSWAENVETTGPKWSYSLDELFDFNHDKQLNVFDLIEARKALESHKLAPEDVVTLNDYLLTGEWNVELEVYEFYDRYISCFEGDTIIRTSSTAMDGLLLDYYIKDDETMFLRFFKYGNLEEYKLQRETLFLRAENFELDGYGYGISVGYTSEGHLAWDWSWKASEDESIISIG